MHHDALLKPPDLQDLPLTHLRSQGLAAQDTRHRYSFHSAGHVNTVSKSNSFTVSALVCMAFIRAPKMAAEISVSVSEIPVV